MSIDFDEVSVDTIAAIFGVTRATVYNWTNDGCPRHQSGFYTPKDVHKWLVAREVNKHVKKEGGSLKDQKTEREIALLDLKYRKENGEVIERKEHEYILDQRQKAYLAFGRRIAIKNAVFFHGKSVPEIQELWVELENQRCKSMLGVG